MPLFYFDINDGDCLIRDDEGTDLVDSRAARNEAIGVLPSIAKDELPDGDRRDFVSEVRDASGRVIFRATLSLTTEWLD